MDKDCSPACPLGGVTSFAITSLSRESAGVNCIFRAKLHRGAAFTPRKIRQLPLILVLDIRVKLKKGEKVRISACLPDDSDIFCDYIEIYNYTYNRAICLKPRTIRKILW